MDDLVAKGEQELVDLVEQVPEEVLDYIVDLEERVEKAEEAAPVNEPVKPENAFEKALGELDPEIAKAFVDQRERLDKAETAVAAQNSEKADQVWVTKAHAADGLIDKPEEFGAQLRKVADIDSELADSIMRQLQTAAVIVTKSALFTESGHAVVSAGSAQEKVTNIAKAAVDADKALTMADAEAEAWEANPALYDEHVAERRTAVAGGI